MLVHLLSLPVLALLAAASPIERSVSFARRNTSDAVIPLTADQRAEVKMFALFATSAYCTSASVNEWGCGASCDANAEVYTIDSGGDNAFIPRWYVAYSKPLDALIVAHRGTNFKSNVSSAEVYLTELAPLNPILFPNATVGVKAHAGFQLAQAFTAPRIFDAVTLGLTQFETNKVIAVGHSLGGSIATLDALFLKLQFPTVDVTHRVFAPTRVGNPAFANYFPTLIPDSWRINNKNDLVPSFPNSTMGYEHIPGEVYINPSGSVDFCPGNENIHCSLSVPDDKKTWDDHNGPYEGVIVGDVCSA